MARKRTILVVEDDAGARFALITILEEAGYQVFEAASAAEALSISEQEPLIEVLLSDVNLKDGHGTVIAMEIEHDHPEMRTVFISGGREPRLEKGQKYLLKPVRAVRLLKAIKESDEE